MHTKMNSKGVTSIVYIDTSTYQEKTEIVHFRHFRLHSKKTLMKRGKVHGDKEVNLLSTHNNKVHKGKIHRRQEKCINPLLQLYMSIPLYHR